LAKYYLTTAIDYATADPHQGHAFEKIGADAIARYHRLRGDEVHLLIGMDEHGQKVAQTAADRKVSPQELVDAVAESTREIWSLLGISYDQFVRTTDPAHKAGVKRLIEQIFDNSPGDFYEKSYEGWYCVGCESFKQDNEIVDGKCILHPTRVLEWVEEKNWFFRLSAYTDRIRKLVSSEEFLQPKSRRNEILALLDSGLEDISASRSRFSWGVPFPRKSSAGEEQTMYVWFDALPNYLTATGFPNPDYEQLWPADLHLIGKDITRFHAVIWPAMLMAAKLPLPRAIFGHGFMTLGGQRMSKTLGTIVDPIEAAGRFGQDPLRLYLVKEIAFGGDGDFSWARYDERYNVDLANNLGNLVSRVTSMAHRYRGGRLTPTGAGSDQLVRIAEQVVYRPRANAVQVLTRSEEDSLLTFDERGGIKEIPISGERVVLSDDIVRRLATAAANIKRVFGGKDQDIEWAFMKGEIYIVQARPFIPGG